MRAPSCAGARPLRDSARAVLEWRAARTGHGYRVEDKSPGPDRRCCPACQAAKPSSTAARLHYTHENLLPTHSYCTFYRSVDFL